MASLARSLLLANPLTRWLVLRPAFWWGERRQRRTGRTPWLSYYAYRKLYWQTRGEQRRGLLERLQRESPPLPLKSTDGVLGSGPAWRAERSTAVETLRRDGYYRFAARLPREQCEELQRFTRGLPARLTPRPAVGPERAPFDPERPAAARYDYDESQYFGHPAIRALLADESLIALAQEYFGTAAINDLTAMWWSAPHGDASSEAAQLFHFDLDRFRFLKIFFYLTDVGPESGPHVYVRGSHERKPPAFYEDRRFTDEEVARAFPAEDVREVTGPIGTILAGDTLCLHKGKALRSGARLIFQIEFAVSLFGQTYEIRPVPPDLADLRRRIAEYPQVYRRFRAE